MKMILFVAILFQSSLCKAAPFEISCLDGELKMPYQNLSVKQRDWKFVYTNYKPTEFTQCITDNCDPDSPKGIKFHQLSDNIFRQTALKENEKFEVKNGYPLNPAGRTGVAGRGYLPRWGPNHLMQLIFTKKINGEKFYLVKLEEGKIYFIENFVEIPINQWFAKKHTDPLLSILTRKIGDRNDAWDRLDELKKKSKQMLIGSIPSKLNTDNSWIEIYSLLIQCENDIVVCDGIKELMKGNGYDWLIEKQFKKYVDLKVISKSDFGVENVNPKKYSALLVNRFLKHHVIALGVTSVLFILVGIILIVIASLLPITIALSVLISIVTIASMDTFRKTFQARKVCFKPRLQ